MLKNQTLSCFWIISHVLIDNEKPMKNNLSSDVEDTLIRCTKHWNYHVADRRSNQWWQDLRVMVQLVEPDD